LMDSGNLDHSVSVGFLKNGKNLIKFRKIQPKHSGEDGGTIEF
jgi:hypothetical protein